jgi:hypothetical protein
MTGLPGAALVQLELSEPVPIEVAVGSSIIVRLRVSCAVGRDRTGMMAKLVAPDGSETWHRIAKHDGAISETAEIVLIVPAQVGRHTWRFVMPPHDIARKHHTEAALEISVRARPQASSLAVWDIPSPVVTGAPFKVKVGAKSSAECVLKGRAVEILRDGDVASCGVLGDVPLAGTAALYWTELELAAPPEAGMTLWTARFEASGLDLPHDDTSTTFSAAVVRPPDHTLTVKVIDKNTASPVEDALVRLGAYRAETGQSGLAAIRLPKGRYELNVWKVGYDIEPTTLDLDQDASIEVLALLVPEEDPDARWKM